MRRAGVAGLAVGLCSIAAAIVASAVLVDHASARPKVPLLGEIELNPHCDSIGQLPDKTEACFISSGTLTVETTFAVGDLGGSTVRVYIEPYSFDAVIGVQNCTLDAQQQTKTHQLPASGTVKYTDTFSVSSGKQWGLCAENDLDSSFLAFGNPIVVTAATATATITGKYRTTITTPASAAGTWTLNFKKNGTGTTTWNGQLTPHNFTFKGSTLTSPGGGANVCPTVGTYRIHLAGNHLTLTVIHDPCKIGRAQVLPGHVWTKVG